MLIFLKNYFIIGDWCQIRFFLVIDFYPIFAEKPRVPKNVIWSIPWLYIFTQRNICIINVEDIIYAHIFHSEAPHDICFATFWSSEFSYSFGKLSDQPQLRWIIPSCPWLFWSRNSQCGETYFLKKRWAESVSVSGFCLRWKNISKTIAVNGSDSQLDSKWCCQLVGFLSGTEWPHWMHWTFDVQLGIDFDGVKTTAKMLSCGLLLACSRVHKETSLERGLW